MIEEAINTTLSSFDFAYCIVVDVLTYLLIKLANEHNKCKTKWCKRVVLLCVIVLIGLVYWAIGVDRRLIINSAILAPVCWSWVIKPIFKYYNIDYGCNSKEEENKRES